VCHVAQDDATADLQGMDRALNVLSRALEANSRSAEIWSEYLRLFTTRMRTSADAEREIADMLEHAVTYVPYSFTAWWRYILHAKVCLRPEVGQSRNLFLFFFFGGLFTVCLLTKAPRVQGGDDKERLIYRALGALTSPAAASDRYVIIERNIVKRCSTSARVQEARTPVRCVTAAVRLKTRATRKTKKMRQERGEKVKEYFLLGNIQPF
jgi:hypothetical protein